MCAAGTDDLASALNIRRGWHLFAMANAAMLTEERLARGFGGRVGDISSEGLEVGLAPRSLPGRHAKVLSALANERAELIFGASECDAIPMATGAVDLKQALTIRGSE